MARLPVYQLKFNATWPSLCGRITSASVSGHMEQKEGQEAGKYYPRSWDLTHIFRQGRDRALPQTGSSVHVLKVAYCFAFKQKKAPPKQGGS